MKKAINKVQLLTDLKGQQVYAYGNGVYRSQYAVTRQRIGGAIFALLFACNAFLITFLLVTFVISH